MREQTYIVTQSNNRTQPTSTTDEGIRENQVFIYYKCCEGVFQSGMQCYIKLNKTVSRLTCQAALPVPMKVTPETNWRREKTAYITPNMKLTWLVLLSVLLPPSVSKNTISWSPFTYLRLPATHLLNFTCPPHICCLPASVTFRPVHCTQQDRQGEQEGFWSSFPGHLLAFTLFS